MTNVLQRISFKFKDNSSEVCIYNYRVGNSFTASCIFKISFPREILSHINVYSFEFLLNWIVKYNTYLKNNLLNIWKNICDIQMRNPSAL